jgi:DNA-binding PadR family transcriptional regulator
MKPRSHRRSPLALAVLGLLYEAPMHPYRMQQLIKERGKDEVVNVRERASIYQTIDRLQRAGLITVAETARDEKRPERTVYRLTEEGREITRDWLREMLSTPAREFPAFPVALAFLPLLTPAGALRQLEVRSFRLAADLARLEAEVGAARDVLPRLFLIESEYLLAMARAELAWVRALADDLRAGRLTWSEDWLRAVASAPALGEIPEPPERRAAREREREEGGP